MQFSLSSMHYNVQLKCTNHCLKKYYDYYNIMINGNQVSHLFAATILFRNCALNSQLLPRKPGNFL